MRATVWIVQQWYRGYMAGGDEDHCNTFGLVFAVDEAQAIAALPSGLGYEPVGQACGTYGPVRLEEVGEIDVGQELPVYLEIG